jgi:hypothetical protein
MKLSDLEKFVALLRQSVHADNPDPEVSFWPTLDTERLIQKSPLDRPMFCDLVPDLSNDNPAAHMTKEGEICWPLVAING